MNNISQTKEFYDFLKNIDKKNTEVPPVRIINMKTGETFPTNEMTAFIKMQRNFKTFMWDDAMDLVRELLNRKYKLTATGEFKTLEDFKKQVNDPVSDARDTLNIIPISWINVVMQTMYHTSRKNDKIAAAMNDEFIYRKQRCNSGNCMCLVRKDSLSTQMLDIL